MLRQLSSIVLCALFAGSAVSQCFGVTTLTTAGNGQNGTMFNVVNNSAGPVTIVGFEQCWFAAGTDTVEIYTKAGTWQGFESTAAAWTLVGSAPGVVHGVAPALVTIPIAVNTVVAPGATQGFYITSASGGTVAYTTGVGQLGAVIGSDANISVTGGVGKSYPFGSTFGLPTAGRLWNGRVLYSTGGACVTASNTSLGSTCAPGSFNSFYQLFASATTASPALTGNSLQLTATGNGYVGLWLPGSAAGLFVTPGGGATVLATGDDGVVTYAPTAPLSTPYGAVTPLSISGNGIIGFQAGTMDYPGTNSYTPTAAGFLNSALGGVYAWHDYNSAEAGSGPVLAEEIGGTLYVTYNGVENYANPETANPSTLQFQLNLATGNITIVFLSIDGNASSTFGSGTLVGVTAPGASQDPGSVDLATATPIVVANPETIPMTLSATSRPLIGTNWNLQVNNVSPGSTLGVEVFGFTDPGINDLFFIGMPGCGLRASLDVLNAFLPAGSTHNYVVAIPNSPAVVGLSLYTTVGMFLLPPPNSFGAVTTNAIQGLIGNL